MELVIAAFGFVAAAVGGVILNVLAADVYDRCPRIAKSILEHAVRRLPEDKRDRYREEWASHLSDCTTKLDQVRHAVGSWWSVGGIIRQSPRVKRQYRLDFIIVGSAVTIVSGTGEAVFMLLGGVSVPLPIFILYAIQIGSAGYVVVVGLRLRKEKGNIIEM